NPLLKNISPNSQVWMSHGDTISAVPANFNIIASTDHAKVADYQIENSQTYGIQFHPEVTHSIEGKAVFDDVIIGICGCTQDWTADIFVETSISSLREQLGDDHVVLALSGGVDSSVAAILLHRAIGKNLHCIFVDNGLLRKDEFQQVLDSYEHM